MILFYLFLGELLIQETNYSTSMFFYSDTTFPLIAYVAHGNYNGSSYAAALQTAMNAAAVGVSITYAVSYNFENNLLTISFQDDRPTPPDTMTTTIFSDASVIGGQTAYYIVNPKSQNDILNVRVHTSFTELQPFSCYLDLHNTRNLYLMSSALASNDTVIGFGNDTIIKKFPVVLDQMMFFDNASEGFDF